MWHKYGANRCVPILFDVQVSGAGGTVLRDVPRVALLAEELAAEELAVEGL